MEAYENQESETFETNDEWVAPYPSRTKLSYWGLGGLVCTQGEKQSLTECE